MKRPIPSYRLHVRAFRALRAEQLAHPIERCAIIICTDDNNPVATLFPEMQRITLPFADVTNAHRPDAFHASDAHALVQFVYSLPDRVTDLYICCHRGESRSAAVAAALMLASGTSDRTIWNDPHYHPNPLVFSILCRAFGIFMPSPLVRLRTYRSRRALHRAIQGKQQ